MKNIVKIFEKNEDSLKKAKNLEEFFYYYEKAFKDTEL